MKACKRIPSKVSIINTYQNCLCMVGTMKGFGFDIYISPGYNFEIVGPGWLTYSISMDILVNPTLWSKLGEYTDTTRDVLVSVVYFYWVSLHDESFVKEYLLRSTQGFLCVRSQDTDIIWNNCPIFWIILFPYKSKHRWRKMVVQFFSHPTTTIGVYPGMQVIHKCKHETNPLSKISIWGFLESLEALEAQFRDHYFVCQP